MNKPKSLGSSLFFIVFLSASLCYSLILPDFYATGMVLQRDSKVKIFGKTASSTTVSVSIQGKTYDSQSSSSGEFEMFIGPLTAGGPMELKISSSSGTKTIDSVYIGEVWFLSGQSNMGSKVSTLLEKYDEGDFPFPREEVFSQQELDYTNPAVRHSRGDKWIGSSPGEIPGFGALAHGFGMRLHELTGVPIGMYRKLAGGTALDCWLPDDTTQWAEFPSPQDWERDSDGDCYEEKLLPATRYTVRGAIWYQGHTDRGNGVAYRNLLPTLALTWQKLWDQETFYFLNSVHHNVYSTKSPESAAKIGYAFLREAQFFAKQVIPNGGHVNTMDVGDGGPHPNRVKKAGIRFAEKVAVILGEANTELAAYPTLQSYKTEGLKFVLSFSNSEGMELKGALQHPAEPGTFLIQGTPEGSNKMEWRFATGLEIRENGEVVVWDEGTPAFSSVNALRYAWNELSPGFLYNKHGLPAYPFRTDVDWSYPEEYTTSLINLTPFKSDFKPMLPEFNFRIDGKKTKPTPVPFNFGL